MTLARRSTKTGSVFLLDADTLPQTVGVVRTRAAALGLEVVVADGPLLDALEQVDAFAVLVQTPARPAGWPPPTSSPPSPTGLTGRAPSWSPPATCWRSL